VREQVIAAITIPSIARRRGAGFEGIGHDLGVGSRGESGEFLSGHNDHLSTSGEL
jgi:hypothetical protein